MSKKIAHLETVTLDTKLATSKQLNADEILANGEDVADMFNREHTYREMTSRVKLQPEDNYILYGNDGKVVSANLSGVQNGTHLFSNQSKLTEIPLSWKLDSITDGTSMCESCTNLTTFSFPLNSLSNGSEMFNGCNLNEESVENILLSLPEYTSGTHSLSLNMSAGAFEKFNEITENYLMAPGTISYKGWELTSNAVITIPVEELTTAIEELIGEGKVIVDTIPTENKVVIHTDRVDDNQFEIVTMLLERVLPQNVEAERYNHSIEVNWQDINKYAECKSRAEMEAVNPNYLQDITSDGTWVYPLPKLNNLSSAAGKWSPWRYVKALRFFDEGVTFDHIAGAGSIYEDVTALFMGTSLEEIPRTWTFSNSWNLTRAFDGTKVRVIPNSIKLLKLSAAYEMFENTQLQHIEDDLELISLSAADNMFSGCQLDAESVPRVLDGLPSYTSDTHKIGLGIHVDHENDETVLTSIANAEAKGWTLTVQWNGTPTAQSSTTYGLRKPPIYANIIEYKHPDGMTGRILDWGHYVTNTDGYEEFASIEEAREYYGLPDENIEEEELTNV